MERRKFIGKAITGFLITASAKFPYSAFVNDPALTTLNILHTNDVHSRIDPFPMDGSRNQGLGGAAKRAALISKLRKENENLLLFDCGDVFQGTPYFNFFEGELEMKLMSEMNYDAGTMGNHDFDMGIDGFERQLKHANFPFIVSNYNFADTVLNNRVDKYKIFESGDIKIGVFGLGIKLDGLVPAKLYKNTVYEDPIVKAQQYADILKKDFKCDLVVCLSHLGYKYRSNNLVSDLVIASSTKNIDLILGGHTHTFMKQPKLVTNLKGDQVIISQAGWGGILMGHIKIHFEKNKKRKCVTCNNQVIK